MESFNELLDTDQVSDKPINNFGKKITRNPNINFIVESFPSFRNVISFEMKFSTQGHSNPLKTSNSLICRKLK